MTGVPTSRSSLPASIFYSRLALSLLLAAPFQSFAQPTADSPPHRFYVGLGLRYRLTPHLGLNSDLTTNRNLTHPDRYRGFTGSAALGLRYRFGK